MKTKAKTRTHLTLLNKIHKDLKASADKENQKLAGFHDSIVVLGLEKYKELKCVKNVNSTVNNAG